MQVSVFVAEVPVVARRKALEVRETIAVVDVVARLLLGAESYAEVLVRDVHRRVELVAGRLS